VDRDLKSTVGGASGRAWSACATWTRAVDFLLLDRPRDAELWRSLTRIIEDERTLSTAALLPWLDDFSPKLALVDWRDPLPRLHAGIAPFPAHEEDQRGAA
jgi:hypothetical protein